MAAVASQNILRISRHGIARVAGCYTIQRRTEFTVVKPGDHSNLAAYKRGRGGRSSFSGIVATVFGANGRIGKLVVNRLGAMGSQVICPYRGEGYYMKDLKLAGDLGQILFMEYDIRDEKSVRTAIKYSNVVFNLVGDKQETKNFNFEEINHLWPQRLARFCTEAGVERLFHFSDLAASHDAPGHMLKGGSNFLRTKQAGEDAVRDAFPNATIFRPAPVICHTGGFAWHYLSEGRRMNRGHQWLWKYGTETVKAPVVDTDVSAGVAKALQDSKTKGKVIEAYGPKAYTLESMVIYLIKETREHFCYVKDLRLSPRFWYGAYRNEYLRHYLSYTPPFTWESLEAECHSDIITGGLSLEDLGVQLNAMEPLIHQSVRRYRGKTYQEDPLMQDTMEYDAPVYRYVNKRPIVHYGLY